MKGILVSAFILTAAVLMTGCRIGSVVFEGGDVISASGTRHCFEGSTCEFQVTDTDFSESFTARPRTGFVFTRWQKGDGFFCGNSTNPVCTVSNVGSAGNAAIEAVVASDQMFYIMPVFTCVGDCPVRPDPNHHALDDALVALDEAKTIVAAYVANNGHYPVDALQFGVNTSLRVQSDNLAYIDVSTAVQDGPVYLSAAVFRSFWDDSAARSYGDTAFFSLSGSTNADNTMTWVCIPGRPGEPYVPNGPNAIPEPYLPVDCRG